MSDLNQGVEEYLNYYCGFRYAPHYAVLVSGAWGAGKTHVVKRFLKRYEQYPDKPKHLYVSLYGITSFREVEDAFFRQLHPLLASKGMKLAASVARGLLRTTLKIDIKGEDTSISSQVPEIDLPSYLTSTTDRILVFDDIERCEIPPKRILGYINSLVEHDDCKAILIANEKELFPASATDGQERSYGRIKEKLIGKTLEVRPEFDEALTEFIDTVDDSGCNSFYKAQREELRTLFGQSESDNLRVLQQTMWDFERFRPVFSEQQWKNESAICQLFRVFFSLSFELKIGRLRADDIAQLQGQGWAGALRRVNDPKQPLTVMETLQKRYPEVDFNQTMIGWATLRDALAKSLIDVEEIRASLKQHPLFAPPGSEPAWRTVWYGWERTDQEVNVAITTMERELQERRFILPGEILHVAGLRLWLTRIGALPKTLVQVVDEIKRYIDNLVTDRILNTDGSWEFFNLDMGWSNLGFRDAKTLEFQEIKAYLMMKRREAIEAGYPDRAKELLAEMVADSSLFFRRICLSNSSDSTYHSIPILGYVDPDEFVTRLLNLPRAQQRTVLMALGSRYEHMGITGALATEAEWLQSVNTKLQSAASQMQPVARDSMEQNLIHWITPALEQLAAITTTSETKSSS